MPELDDIIKARMDAGETLEQAKDEAPLPCPHCGKSIVCEVGRDEPNRHFPHISTMPVRVCIPDNRYEHWLTLGISEWNTLCRTLRDAQRDKLDAQKSKEKLERIRELEVTEVYYFGLCFQYIKYDEVLAILGEE